MLVGVVLVKVMLVKVGSGCVSFGESVDRVGGSELSSSILKWLKGLLPIHHISAISSINITHYTLHNTNGDIE